ncbi:hypothetical protein SUGI_0326340 [Cryptomeria japonica]|uniref:uncharacterized protein LOC131073980 n=1 Tax=Cryptomeria japonica TaxID=3369 RepID=UPI002408BD89|nr:uncharacterized protein LOC131073980 [Cryptomeria japonica]GLJ18415.1 hypothetical protein SUGI_0326340 [Cryptomeria japonica]
MPGMEVEAEQERKGIYSLMRRVSSLENLLKKLRWEKGAEPAQARFCESERRALAYGEVCVFQMPLNYPRYSKADYESMPEWRLDLLFQEYGLALTGDLAYKRNFAMGAFLWPQY